MFGLSQKEDAERPMVERNTSELVKALQEALKPVLGAISDVPSDVTHADPAKIDVRVRYSGWVGEDVTLNNPQPARGREDLSVTVGASWQHWGYDSIKEQNRKVIKALQDKGWTFSEIQFVEDDDGFDAVMGFYAYVNGRY